MVFILPRVQRVTCGRRNAYGTRPSGDSRRNSEEKILCLLRLSSHVVLWFIVSLFFLL